LLGDSAPAADRAGAGSLVVLCAWTAFVVAGGSFQRLSEHFTQAVPARSQVLPVAAFDAVFVAAVVGGLLVLAGAALALPAFLRFLRAGGWGQIQSHFVWAVAATVVAGIALLALVAVAHTLTPAQRNGELLYHPAVWYYSLQFVVTGLLGAAMLVLWTAAAVATARRLALSPAVLRAEAVLALAVMVMMALMTVATSVWWGAVSSSAPAFLQGVPAGAPASGFDLHLVGTMSLMLVATVAAAYGAIRIARSWREMRLA
jgi:hypothetical protein